MKFRELKVGDVFIFKSSHLHNEYRQKIAYRKYTDYPITESSFIRKGRGESDVVKIVK